jgi:hypothetical protein
MITLLSESFFSWPVEIGVAVGSFALGFLLKRAIIAKLRKRIYNLEDEMLSNHARILELEKKLSEPTAGKNGVAHDYDLLSSRKSDSARKIS